MKTQLAPGALLMSPKDETTLLLVNPEKVNAFVPRTLNHQEITSGLKWRLEEIQSVFLPLEEVKFPNIESKEVIASPFKMINGKREIQIKDIQNIYSTKLYKP